MANSIEDEILRGITPSLVAEQRALLKALEQQRSTAQKKQAVRNFRTQLLRDERFRDSFLPNYRSMSAFQASPIEVPRGWLRRGWNILGVNTPGPVTVRLPSTARKSMMITVKDERGSASSEPITIEVYNP